jgi:serine/threonine protein kinase
MPSIPDIPSKKFFFNFSVSTLRRRQRGFETFLAQLIALRPVPQQLGRFLEVDQHIRRRLLQQSSRLRSASALGPALTIHDFQLIKVLGQGSFGKVFLVRPVGASVEEVYAMKVLKKSEVERRHQVEHTKAERNIMASITHPFILSLKYAFQTADKLYMITDYCRGGELFFHLKRLKRFNESMMRFYSAEIALALHYLHLHDIVYRDLKVQRQRLHLRFRAF